MASALGLDNILTTTPVTTVTASGTANSSFNTTDGTSTAEKYGAVLASLSGIGKTNGTTKSIELVAAGIDVTGNLGTVNTNTQSLLVAGASTAAENTNSAGRDVLTETVADAAKGTSTTPSTVEDDLANALLAIKDGAAANNENNATGSLSTSQFTQAGVTGVTASNLAAINSALDSTSVTGTQVDTTSKIQDLVNAYSAILSGADGNATNNNATATDAQYALVGVTGVSTASASLLNDVVDGKAASDVSTVANLQTLAYAANAVSAGASARRWSCPRRRQRTKRRVAERGDAVPQRLVGVERHGHGRRRT